MIAPYHSQRLHDAYGGNTTLVRFAGAHNSQRGDLFLGTVTAFLLALLRPSNEAHPAEGLLYPQPSKLRGLLGRPAQAESSRFTAGRGFQSAGVDVGGERCSHRGRTAGNLAQLVKLCCLCNPAIRPPPRAVSRRYRVVTPPASPPLSPSHGAPPDHAAARQPRGDPLDAVPLSEDAPAATWADADGRLKTARDGDESGAEGSWLVAGGGGTLTESTS